MRILNSVVFLIILMMEYSAYGIDVNNVKATGPAALKVVCGDILIRIDGPAKWTLNRLEYKKTPLWIENSACGTIFTFPGIGHIGTGHLVDCEDGAEDVLKLQLWLDGKEMSWPKDKSFLSSKLQLCLNGKPLPASVETLTGENFKQHKISRILDIDVNCIIQLSENRLYEETTISTKKEIPLVQAYNLTHAWTATATAFLSGKDDGEEISGELKDSNDAVNVQYINKDVDWVSIYDGPSGKGVVSRLLESPSTGGAISFIRNCPTYYRKYALISFTKETMPAGFKGTYKMVTGFFEASSENWQAEARKIAEELKKFDSQL